MIWPLLATLVLAVIAVVVFRNLNKSRSSRQCPHCESRDLIALRRETLGSRTIEQSPSQGMGGGTDIRLRLDIEATYTCKVCRKESKFRFLEMQ